MNLTEIKLIAYHFIFSDSQALLYLIRVMDHIVENDYVVVYFHTQVTGKNHPPMAYMKMVYNYLDVR